MPFIYTQLNQKDYCPDNCQAVVKRVVNDKAHIAVQCFLMVRKSDASCLYGYRLLRYEKFKDQKDCKIEKNHSPIAKMNCADGGQSVKLLIIL